MRKFFRWFATGVLCAIVVTFLVVPDAWSRATGFIGTVLVNQGGTGATSLTDGGILLGSGTGAITAAAVLASGEVLVGDGTTDPVAQTLSGDARMTAGGAVTVGHMTDKIVLCGQNVSSATVYGGPATAAYLGGGGEYAIGGTVCNTLDSGTEATADAPISANFPAFKVTGMHCIVSSDATNDVVLTLRSAAAGLTPAIACTVAGSGSGQHCSTTTTTTTDIATGATIAVQAVTTEDLSAQDFWCQVYFVVK